MAIHKAVPQDGTHGVSACVSCAAPVKRVPGGNGSIWVHSETGTIVGSGAAGHQSLAEACRMLTQIGTTPDGGIVVGPQGWAKLQEVLKRAGGNA